jgi:hypothetical protein
MSNVTGARHPRHRRPARVRGRFRRADRQAAWSGAGAACPDQGPEGNGWRHRPSAPPRSHRRRRRHRICSEPGRASTAPGRARVVCNRPPG